jgi:hypothetical protein
MPPATFYYEGSDVVDELATGQDAIFESGTRYLIFAASVGFARDRWVSDPAEENEVRWSYIDQNQRLSVITAALTYTHTDDPESILDADRQIEVLQGYAAGGSRILHSAVVDEPGDNLDNLISFLQDHRDSDESSERVGVLEEIEADVSSIRSTE